MTNKLAQTISVWAILATVLLALAWAPAEALAAEGAEPPSEASAEPKLVAANAAEEPQQGAPDVPETEPEAPAERTVLAASADSGKAAGEDPAEGEAEPAADAKAAPESQPEKAAEGGTAASSKATLVYGERAVIVEGGSPMALSDIMAALGIDADASDVSFSDASALKITGAGASATIEPAEGATATVYVIVATDEPAAAPGPEPASEAQPAAQPAQEEKPAAAAPKAQKRAQALRGSGSGSPPSSMSGSVYIGGTWMDDNYQSYFSVSNFSGGLSSGWQVGSMVCADPTAAAPEDVWADYSASLSGTNPTEGWAQYSVYITPPDATDGYTYNEYGLTGYQHVRGTVRISWSFTGCIEVTKGSTRPGVTDGYSQYSTAGAVFGVYDSSGALVEELTTGDDGKATSAAITAGAYTVREITPPSGFQADATEYSVTVAGGQTSSLTVNDAPITGRITLAKRSASEAITGGRSQYSLAGAVYGVYTDAACTIAARDVSGNVVTMSTDASGNARSAELRLGTYYVKETSPSRGYTLDATAHAATISTGDASVTSYESPITGFVVLNKRSGSTSVTSGNPNYSLAGAVYGIYADGACNAIARDTSGNAVYLTTDANGNTQSSGKLRLGTYYMKEISASPGYMLDSTVYPVSLTTGTVTVTVNEQPRTDPMNMVKVDQDTYDPATWSLSNNKPQGSATLEGAEFTVMYYYDHYDSVDDIAEAASANGEYETTAEALKSLAVRTWVFKTDSRGYARVSDAYFAGGDELYRSFDGSATIPIGTVVVFESKAPRGYNLPEDVYHITWITISETAKPFISEDKVVENHIEGLKRDIDDRAPIADTEFTLWRLKAEHVAIDDGNVLTVNDDADLDDMANWEKIAALFTDAHGLADFGNLPIGYYRMLETHSPASGEYMSDGETREGGSATQALYPVYFTIDSTTSDSVQVIENRKIQIETTVEKTTITITSIGFAYKDEKGAERDNTGTEKMRYDVGYSSGNSNTYADEYWVYDHCDFAASPYDLRITDIYLPVCEGDTDGMLWLLVRTNLTDPKAGTASEMNFAQPELHPGTLCDGTMRFDATGWDFWGQFSATARAAVNVAEFLDAAAGEYVTGLCLVHGAVEKGFRTTTPLSYLVAATHALEVGTVIPNSVDSHISRNWSSTLHTPEGDVPKEPGGLKDDAEDEVETRVVETFETGFERGLGEWARGYSYGHRYQKHTYYTRSYSAVRGMTRTGDALPAASLAILCAIALASAAAAALALMKQAGNRRRG